MDKETETELSDSGVFTLPGGSKPVDPKESGLATDH